MDARWSPVREKLLLTVHTFKKNYCESFKSLEGDYGRDRVRRCCLSMSFQEGLHQLTF